jgi:prohibitin 1
MKKLLFFAILLFLSLAMSRCAVVRPDEIGIHTRLGRIIGEPFTQRSKFFNPFIATVVKFPIRVVQISAMNIELPTKDALNVTAQIALLYRLRIDAAKKVYINYGKNYERTVVLATFRSVVRDVSAQFLARDLVTAERDHIQKMMVDGMNKELKDKGFEIESVLFEEIDLPEQITQAIENNMKAEQEAKRMEFVLLKERKEAERKQIEAEGIRNYQKTISEGLNEMLLRWSGIQALERLSNSPNGKIIVTGGSTPMMLNTGDK